jgi:hypothetical protein
MHNLSTGTRRCEAGSRSRNAEIRWAWELLYRGLIMQTISLEDLEHVTGGEGGAILGGIGQAASGAGGLLGGIGSLLGGIGQLKVAKAQAAAIKAQTASGQAPQQGQGQQTA